MAHNRRAAETVAGDQALSRNRTAGDEHKVYGIHAVESLLQGHPDSIKRLLMLEDRQDQRMGSILKLAQHQNIAVESRSRTELDRLAGGVHQGIIALCGPLILASEKELELRWQTLRPSPLILVLDGVMDPRNLGACLRSAEGAGVDAVLLPKRHSAPLSSVARKTASGAAESLMLVSVSNLARRLRWLKAQGVWIVGTDAASERSYDEADFSQPTALVLGSEGRGMRALTREHCDLLVSIPMVGSVASLNVSVAAGILLFEAARQRKSAC